MTHARPVDKRRLSTVPRRRACQSEHEAQLFRRDVGRFFSMSSHPEGVSKTVRPIFDYLRSKDTSELHVQIGKEIEDVRVSFQPRCAPEDEETSRSMTVTFIIRSGVGGHLPAQPGPLPADFGKATAAWKDATSLAEKAAAVDAYCRLLARRCEPHDPVRDDIEVDVVSSDSVTRDDLHLTDPIRVESLSR